MTVMDLGIGTLTTVTAAPMIIIGAKKGSKGLITAGIATVITGAVTATAIKISCKKRRESLQNNNEEA